MLQILRPFMSGLLSDLSLLEACLVPNDIAPRPLLRLNDKCEVRRSIHWPFVCNQFIGLSFAITIRPQNRLKKTKENFPMNLF